jgi:asparagine synthase (glutamine-hydrolysing)
VTSIDDVYYNLISHHQSPGDFLLQPGEIRHPLWSKRMRELMPDPIDRMRYADILTYLPDDILTKVDRASMAVALEVRVPFLDHRIVEWVWRLPTALNSRAPRPKHMLRRVLQRYLPERLIDRPKMGFGVPLEGWLRGPLREWAEHLLTRQLLEEGGIFHPEAVRKLWTNFLAGNENNHYLIWNFLMFQDWHRVWGRKPVPNYASVGASARASGPRTHNHV